MTLFVEILDHLYWLLMLLTQLYCIDIFQRLKHYYDESKESFEASYSYDVWSFGAILYKLIHPHHADLFQDDAAVRAAFTYGFNIDHCTVSWFFMV